MRNAYLVFNGALLYFQIPKRQGKKTRSIGFAPISLFAPDFLTSSPSPNRRAPVAGVMPAQSKLDRQS